MATKPKAKKKAAPKKAKPRKAEQKAELHRDVKSAPTPVAPTINDVREDDAAVLGQFVDVVKGEHGGRYGVFVELAQDGKTAVVRTRDSASERLLCPVSSLRPALAGRR